MVARAQNYQNYDRPLAAEVALPRRLRHSCRLAQRFPDQASFSTSEEISHNKMIWVTNTTRQSSLIMLWPEIQFQCRKSLASEMLGSIRHR